MTLLPRGAVLRAMTPQKLRALDQRLTAFLEDLLAPLGCTERRHWARVYVQGLLLDSERKSTEFLARRIPGAIRRRTRYQKHRN
jgi:SRSO17 transposase